MKKRTLLRLLNFWPPFLGAGIRVTRISPDMREIDVEMKLRWWNRNYVGTHFGGSLYSMTDPFYMLILIENLGRDYIVWDKASTIRYKSPGRSKVFAKFKLSPDEISAIKNMADTEEKFEPILNVQIKDEMGKVVAEVERTLYVKRKDKKSSNTKLQAK